MSTTTTTKTKSSGPEVPTKFVEHVKGYPTVKSGVSTFQSYPLGQKSVETVQTYYANLLVPFLQNFAGPYSFVAPYVVKADGLADSGLQKVDTQFPIITKEPQDIKAILQGYAYSPFRVANDGKTYVLNTYSQEYKKCGGDNAGPVISGSKAAITTSMVITSDTLSWLSSFLSARRAEGHEFASAKYKQGQQFASTKYAQGSDYAHQGVTYVNGKKDEAINYASETADYARNLAYVKADQAKAESEKLKKEAKAKAGK